MKKWMSFALAVALFATTVLGGAFAESALDTMAEESGLYVEASVSAPASQDTEEDASCSDLESPVEELPELQLPTGYDDEPVVLPEAVEAESTDSAYARLIADADVLSAEGEILCALSAGDAVLLTGAPSDGRAPVAFSAAGVTVEGTLPEHVLEVLDAPARDALLDALAAGEVAAYHGDINRLLPEVDCALAQQETEGIDSQADSEPAEETVESEPALSDEENAGDVAAPASTTDTEAEEDAEDVAQAADPADPAEGDVGEVPELAAGAEENPGRGEGTAAIEVSQTSLRIGAGESCDLLTARAVDASGNEDPEVVLTWESSDVSIATVDGEGTITGVAPGATSVLVYAAGYAPAAVTVTVLEAPGSITLQLEEMHLYLGSDGWLHAILPEGSFSRIHYTSDNPSVATVDDSGNVTAMALGTATITAATFNHCTATCRVTVCDRPHQIRFAADPINLGIGGTTTVSAEIQDKYGRTSFDDLNLEVTKGSEYIELSGIACTDSRITGTVRAIANGTAEITCTSAFGIVGVCTVNVVSDSPKALKFNRSSVTIGVKEAYRGLTVNLVPQDGEPAALGTVTWKTSNKKIAKVAKAGDTSCVITGVKKGTAKITASCNGKTATITVKVKPAPKKITTSPATLQLVDGSTGTIAGKPVGSTGCSTFTYTSSNPSVALVDPTSGRVTAVSKGIATITVRSFNNKTATAKVQVFGKCVSLELGESSMEILEGQSFRPTVKGYDADGEATIPSFVAKVDSFSANPECVEVNAATGEIRGLRSGSARVFFNGFVSVFMDVTVKGAPERIALNRGAFSMGLSERYEGLAVQLIPHEGEESCEAIVSWTSSKPKIVSVAKAGDTGCVLTAKKTGKAVITATTHNGKRAAITVTVGKKPSKVVLSPATLHLSVGMTGRVNASVNKGAGSAGFTYRIDDDTVASLDESGNLLGLTAGQSTTVHARAFNGKEGRATVVVHPEPDRVELDKSEITFIAGQSAALKASAYDAEGAVTYANYTYTSESDCVSVNRSTGVVSGLKKGTATVTATTHNGKTATCTVNVEAAPVDIVLSESSMKIGLSEVARGITCRLVPPEGEDECKAIVTWTTSNKKVATVTPSADRLSASIKGVKKGTATITVTTHNGLKKTIKVTVQAKPSKLTIGPATVTVAIGDTARITSSTNKSTASYGVTYTVANPELATVDQRGVVTGLAKGSTTVYGKTYNGKKSNTIRINVVKPAVLMRLPESSKTLAEGMTWRIVPSVEDEDGETTYTSSYRYTVISGGEYVSVDGGGNLRALLAGGQATVRVSAANGVYEDCIVDVIDAPDSLTITEPATHELSVGETFTILPTVTCSGRALPVGSYGITYTVSSSAASVTADGVLTGVRIARSVTVTARTYNGLTASFTVLVKQPRYRLFRAFAYYKSGKAGDLPFPNNNSNGIYNAFRESNIGGYKYQNLANLKNPSKASLLSSLQSKFADSIYTDVNIIYLCSHGVNYNGQYRWCLPGYNISNPSKSSTKTYVTAGEILNAIKGIEGRTVLILDSCYSGVFLDNVSGQLSQYSGKIAVMTAASNTSACYYNVSESRGACDFFTFFLMGGIGYSVRDKSYVGGMPADRNSDRKVTVEELFRYGSSETIGYVRPFGISPVSWFHGDANQTPRFYANGLGNLVIYGID